MPSRNKLFVETHVLSDGAGFLLVLSSKSPDQSEKIRLYVVALRHEGVKFLTEPKVNHVSLLSHGYILWAKYVEEHFLQRFNLLDVECPDSKNQSVDARDKIVDRPEIRVLGIVKVLGSAGGDFFDLALAKH